jgi:hypothetical protein
MIFTYKKLPLEKVADLIPFQLTPSEDYKILGSPVYLLLQKNGKIVSLKEPLDFFTPEEREKIGTHGSQLFVSALHERAERFFRHGVEIRRTLSWLEEGEGPQLEPSPFEVSHDLRLKLNPVWSRFSRKNEVIFGVESFFIPFLVNGICGSLPGDLVELSRTQNFGSYEIALLKSSLLVFFLLHLSYLDAGEIENIRMNCFQAVYNEKPPTNGEWHQEVFSLYQWIDGKFPDSQSRLLTSEDLEAGNSVVLHKVNSRVKNFITEKLESPLSVHGVNGFVESPYLVGIKGSESARSLDQEFLEVKDVG